MNYEQKIDYLYQTVKLQSVKPCDFTVAEWSEEWLQTFKAHKVRPSTYERYQRTLKHIKKLFGNMIIANFDILSAQKIFNSIKQPSIKDDCYTLLNEMFEKAVRIRLIAFNPIKAIEITKHKKEHGKAFTKAQEIAFVSACENHYRGIAFIICLYTGLRRGELLGLTASDIDLQKRVIHITKQCQDGKFVVPKTESSIRDVPIFDNLYNYLIKAKLPKSGRLFPIKEHAIREHFLNVLAESNLDGQGFTLHDLRHTFITRCAENGVPRHLLQKWVGHSTSDMTENVYTHCNNDFEYAEIDNFNKRIKDTNNQENRVS